MNAAVLEVVEQVIRTASRERPADRCLRDALRFTRGLAPGSARQVSRRVFSYYRWRGWLDASQSIPQQSSRALDLADRFAANPASFGDDELVARALPQWACREMRVTPGMVRALQAEPRLWLRARRGEGGAVARALGECTAFGAGHLADTLEYRGSEDLFRTAGFHEGLFELQDVSSQAVGFVCAPDAGETWWDACAGEGGKTLHLSGLMHGKGLVWASDTAAWRLRSLKRRCARAGVFNYRAVLWEADRLPTRTKFDGVLLDAPCSGTGTWQRNPHARWTTSAEDLLELSQMQARLLDRVSVAVKPGGKLVYAVCTLASRETDSIADLFEKGRPDFKPLAFPHPLGRGDLSSRLLLSPADCGGSGMFIAVWRRSE